MLDAARLIAAKAECEIVVGVAPTLDEQYLKIAVPARECPFNQRIDV